MKPKAERIEIIERARTRTKLFGTHDAYARNADGDRVDPTDVDAVCWCAIGSLRKEFNVPGEPALRDNLGFGTYLAAMPYFQGLIDANDDNRDALDAAFDRLIAALPEDSPL